MGYGVSPEHLRELKKTLQSASDELGMTDFSDKAALRKITTQEVSRYENVEETVDESVYKLSQFATVKYPAVVEAMQDFITRLHVTITTTADGVAQTGADYEINDQQVQDWLKKHGD